MTRPQSSHQALSEDAKVPFGIAVTPPDSICTPAGPSIQDPSPSTSHPTETSLMATTFSETPSAQEARFDSPLMNVDDCGSIHWPSNFDSLYNRFSQEDPTLHTSQQYPSASAPVFGYSDYQHIPNGLPYSDNYHLTYSSLNSGQSCPRSYPDTVDLHGSTSLATDSYPPSAYLLEPQKPQESMVMSDHLIPGQAVKVDNDDEQNCSTFIGSRGAGGYNTPQYDREGSADTSSFPYDTLHTPDDVGKKDGFADDSKEQPYAQLIYKALLEAPGHTMVLKEIYNWFQRNTDKATDKETKGWQNSIRHNLSMNGAFEKVDQPTNDGDEAKKGFMWRLTDDAIREGVKSTTRYRSKLPNKRGHRSQNPAPQRQASGAKGGQAARKSARLRRSERLRDSRGLPIHRMDPYTARSVPSFNPAFDNLPSPEIPMQYPPSPYFCNAEMDYARPPKQEPVPMMFGSGSFDMATAEWFDPPQPAYGNMPQYALSCSPAESLFYESGSDTSGTSPSTPGSPTVCQLDAGVMDPTPFGGDEAFISVPNYPH